MKSCPILRAKVFLGLAVASLLCLSLTARAVTVSYYVDSSLSSLTLAGNAFGLNFTGQGGNANALRDFWGGTITGDLNAGVLTFTGGSAITANLNALAPFSIAPNVNGPPGTGVPGIDAYGPTASGFVTGYGAVTVNAAYRSLKFDITGGTATYGVSPSASGINFQFTGGWLDWGATTGLGPVGGHSTLNAAGLDVATTPVIMSGGANVGDWIMLPVSVHTTGSNRNEYWNGTLIAFIPEPSSLALVGFGLLALVTLRHRRSF